MNNIVVLDIDGVLADFEGSLVSALYRHGSKAMANRDMYRIEDRFADSPEILKDAISITNDPNFYYGLKPCDGSVEFVGELFDAEYRFIYVSSRPASSYNFTRRWLTKHLKDSDPMLFCGVTDKVYFLSRIPESVLFVVEDNPDHIKLLKDAGYTVLCWDQPWNEGIFPRLLFNHNTGATMIQVNPTVEWTSFFVAEGETS